MSDYEGLIARAEKAAREIRGENIDGWANVIDDLVAAVKKMKGKENALLFEIRRQM